MRDADGCLDRISLHQSKDDECRLALCGIGQEDERFIRRIGREKIALSKGRRSDFMKSDRVLAREADEQKTRWAQGAFGARELFSDAR